MALTISLSDGNDYAPPTGCAVTQPVPIIHQEVVADNHARRVFSAAHTAFAVVPAYCFTVHRLPLPSPKGLFPFARSIGSRTWHLISFELSRSASTESCGVGASYRATPTLTKLIPTRATSE